MFEGQNYNCCTNDQEPDWTQFTNLELGGCIEEEDCTTGGIDREEAEFFTIYGRLKEGGCEAITDVVDNVEVAISVAEEHSKRSKLPLNIFC